MRVRIPCERARKSSGLLAGAGSARSPCSRKGVEILRITDQNAEVISITVSVGIAALDPDCFVEESIVRADKALYEAKAAARNRVVIWSPVTQARFGTSTEAPQERG